MARNRRSGLGAYTQQLLALLPFVLPHIVRQRRKLRLRRQNKRADDGHIVALVIGSERGLCGRYNKTILETLATYMVSSDEDVRRHGLAVAAGTTGQALEGQTAGGHQQIDLVAFGSRLIQELTRAGYDLADAQRLSITALPTYDHARAVVSDWIDRYEAYELDGVDVVYNADQGAGTYATTVTRLIPLALPETGLQSGFGSQAEAPVIVETDPLQLYRHIIDQWTSIALYRLLLEAASTEHAARYQLMESATQNADRLIDQLTLTVQSARRQAITREMQELAMGAGLLETST
jgi:ATP synthase F1 gamma subunit